MGKYTKLIARLGLSPLGEEPKYQEKINVVKAAIRDEMGPEFSASGLAAVYAGVRDEKEKLQALLSEVNMRETALEQLIDERFETEDVSNLKLLSGDAISIQREPYAQVIDRDANREWAVASGLERSLALPWSTLNSHVKELLMLGEPAPPGVKLWVRTTVRMTRSKEV